MRRLFWAFTGCTSLIVRFVVRWLTIPYFTSNMTKTSVLESALSFHMKFRNSVDFNYNSWKGSVFNVKLIQFLQMQTLLMSLERYLVRHWPGIKGVYSQFPIVACFNIIRRAYDNNSLVRHNQSFRVNGLNAYSNSRHPSLVSTKTLHSIKKTSDILMKAAIVVTYILIFFIPFADNWAPNRVMRSI